MSYDCTDQEDHALNVLEIAINGEFTDALIWDKYFGVAINCNDLFLPGADAESIYPEDLRLLESCVEDAGVFPEYLFVARKRRMRPRPSMMDTLGRSKLYDACGPERTE